MPTTMRTTTRTTVALLLMALCLGSACGSGGGDEQGFTEEREAEYLTSVREQKPLLAAVTDEQLMGVARSTCEALEVGATREVIMRPVTSTLEPGSPEYAALRFAADWAVVSFCPDLEPGFQR